MGTMTFQIAVKNINEEPFKRLLYDILPNGLAQTFNQQCSIGYRSGHNNGQGVFPLVVDANLPDTKPLKTMFEYIVSETQKLDPNAKVMIGNHYRGNSTISETVQNVKKDFPALLRLLSA